MKESDLASRVEIGNVLWSPVGDRIAYALTRDITSELWVVDPTTGVAMMLAAAQGTEPIQPTNFSPAGDRLFFLQADENGDESLWSAASDGSGGSTLGAGLSTWGAGSVEPFGFSPQGDRILLGITDDPDGDPASNRSLWSVNTDGSGARMLVAGVDWGVWLSTPTGTDEPSP